MFGFSMLEQSKTKAIITIVAGIVTATNFTSAAMSAPIAADSIIAVRNVENPVDFDANPFVVDTVTTSNSSIDHSTDSLFGSTIRTRGSLATGETGTRYTNTSPDSRNGQAGITLFDTLTFGTPGGSLTNVSFDISLDGQISNTGSGAFDGANASVSVRIFDITDLDTWLVTLGTDEDPRVGTTEPALLSSVITFVVGNQGLVDAIGDFSDESVVDDTGAVFSFDLTKSETFEVDPLKEYGISIFAQAGSFGGIASADFLNTSSFEFTELNGATFESGSGVFLSENNAVSVSEPSQLALFVIGLAGLGALRRRNRLA